MSANHELIYGKMNYILIAVGAVLVILGFFLMAGGGAELGPDGYAYEFDESIYSFRRIRLAPIVIMIGFITVAVAILKNFKKAE
jgi:uncharacterized membrane protein